jgi:hypothetical protein
MTGIAASPGQQVMRTPGVSAPSAASSARAMSGMPTSCFYRPMRMSSMSGALSWPGASGSVRSMRV